MSFFSLNWTKAKDHLERVDKSSKILNVEFFFPALYCLDFLLLVHTLTIASKCINNK